jgi:hypothetical protein
MWYWPSLQLSNYERKFVSLYKSQAPGKKQKPGVLRRIYRLQLSTTAQPDQNIPAAVTMEKIQIARRSRVFGITFSGNLDAWRLTVKNSNGTVYTNPTPRTNKPPVVSSLIAGSIYNAAAMGMDAAAAVGTAWQPQLPGSAGFSSGPLTQSYGAPLGVISPLVGNLTWQSRQNFPWLIEPNWVCQPNETLIFEGTDISPTYLYDDGESTSQVRLPQILNIAFYVWEFPGMGR